jgi:hypothetical protein
MLKKRIITLSVAVVMLGGTTGTVSQALIGGTAGAATPVSGQTQIWASLGNGNGPFKVIFTGAVGDHGTAYSVTSSGKPSKKSNTGYKLFKLQKGNILVNSVTLNDALNNNNAPPTTQNNTTCTVTFVVTQPVTIMKGTKAYTGIKGTINVTVSYAEEGPMKNGSCNQSNNAKPVAQYGAVSGTGTVSYG